MRNRRIILITIISSTSCYFCMDLDETVKPCDLIEFSDYVFIGELSSIDTLIVYGDVIMGNDTCTNYLFAYYLNVIEPLKGVFANQKIHYWKMTSDCSADPYDYDRGLSFTDSRTSLIYGSRLPETDSLEEIIQSTSLDDLNELLFWLFKMNQIVNNVEISNGNDPLYYTLDRDGLILYATGFLMTHLEYAHGEIRYCENDFVKIASSQEYLRLLIECREDYSSSKLP